jgi:DNA polymerase (family 10)
VTPAFLTKSAVAERLRQAGAMLRLGGENGYRARAYEIGADALDALGGDADLATLASEGRLTEIPGIGPSLAGTITELVRTGSAETLNRIAGDLPLGLLEVARVPGMTMRRLRLLHETLDVQSLDDLRRALDSGAVEATKGFGPQTATRMRQGLEAAKRGPERVLLVDALVRAESLCAHLREVTAVVAAEIVGSVRRWAEVVGDVNLVAASDEPGHVLDAFARHPSIASARSVVLPSDRGPGTGICEGRLFDGLPVTLRVVPPSLFVATVALATGSAAHQRQLAARAAVRRVDLATLDVQAEAAFYDRLGLPLIPAELREGSGEIEAADGGDDFADVLAVGDIRGLVHCHTTYSDGANSVAEMARAAEKLGMDYLTITDHSPSAFYAGGVSADRLPEQWREIAEAQATTPVRILRGTESDILRDGALDYPDELLRSLEVVIASVHNRHKLDSAAMTERLLRAVAQPVFKIWGHPLGRLLQRREPIACDVEAVLDGVARGPTAIEINGSPHRLDLPAPWARAARARGIKFVISTDAHSTAEFDNLKFGVAQARRAGLRRGDVLNTLPAPAFVAAVRPNLSA